MATPLAPTPTVPLAAPVVDPDVICDDETGELNIRSTVELLGGSAWVEIEVNTAPHAVEAFGFYTAFDAARLTFDDFEHGELTTGFDSFDVSQPAPGVIRVTGSEAGAETITTGSTGRIITLHFTVDTGVLPGETLPLHMQDLVDHLTSFSTSDGCITAEHPPDGDVTCDGRITPADALLALQDFLGLADPPLNTYQQASADVTHDGRITPADALCIFRNFLGLPSCLD